MRRARARGGDTRARSASLVLAAATLACLASADAFSIGIDLGAESTTVAASRSGGSARDVSVVPDDRGGRSSPSLVGFTERHAARVLGADAESLRATCPRCVFSDPRSLVGVPLSALRDAFGANVSASAEDEARGTARVPFPSALAARAEAETSDPGRTDDADADAAAAARRFFRPETIAAMVVENAARRAERAFATERKKYIDAPFESSSDGHGAFGAFGASDAAVLAVPGWWTQKRRRAFLDAAAVAGAPPSKTRLVSETAAAAVALARRFTDEWNNARSTPRPDDERTVVVAFVGVGARSAWASAVRFTGEAAASPRDAKATKVKKKKKARKETLRRRVSREKKSA